MQFSLQSLCCFWFCINSLLKWNLCYWYFVVLLKIFTCLSRAWLQCVNEKWQLLSINSLKLSSTILLPAWRCVLLLCVLYSKNIVEGTIWGWTLFNALVLIKEIRYNIIVCRKNLVGKDHAYYWPSLQF